MRERKWENHGGRRKGAGRPAGYDRIVLCRPIDVRKPQSIYCSDLELFYLKGLLPYIREYTFLLGQIAHEDGWKGKVWNDTRKEWCECSSWNGWKGTKQEWFDAVKKAEQLPTLSDVFEEWGMDHDIVKDD